MKLEGLEIAHQDVARTVAIGQRVEILPGLPVRFVEIAPGALLLDDQHAWPEQIDKAPAVAELGDMLLVACDGSAADIEHLEEIVVEALRLALLVCRVPPRLGEGRGAHAHLVPREAHPATLLWYRSRDGAARRPNRQRPPARTRTPWRYRGGPHRVPDVLPPSACALRACASGNPRFGPPRAFARPETWHPYGGLPGSGRPSSQEPRWPRARVSRSSPVQPRSINCIVVDAEKLLGSQGGCLSTVTAFNVAQVHCRRELAGDRLARLPCSQCPWRSPFPLPP